MRGVRERDTEAGSTLILVVVLIAILLVITAVAIRGATSDVGTAGFDRTGKTAFVCAESGLRIAVANLGNAATFSATLACDRLDGGTGCGCTGTARCPLQVATDGGLPFVEVWISDNADEQPPTADDPRVDLDNTVYVHSRCVRADLPPREVQILYTATGGGQYYRNQAGQGSTGAGNQNVK